MHDIRLKDILKTIFIPTGMAAIITCQLLVFYGMGDAANKSGVDPQVISLPKGPGSVEGLGESFEPQLNTGTAAYSVKIKVSPGVNKHQPDVVLEYNSGYGNSPLGIGWNLNTEYIQRQTDKGLPSYTDSDTFMYSKNGELVPLSGGIYRLKIEGLFMKFKKTGNTWEAWEKDGTHLYFGTTAGSRLLNPLGTFQWFIEKSVDTNGNEIRYFYETDNGQVYLKEVRYSIMSEVVYKSVVFVYEAREDAFTDYHSRSRMLTARRLAAIEVRSEGNLVRKYELQYKDGTDFSLLSKVIQKGADGTSALPPLSFDYTTYNPQSIQPVTMKNPPPVGISLTNDNVDLIDINGDSLPDMVYTSPGDGKHYFYLNKGNGSWDDTPTIPDASPQHLLSSNGVMMSDMDGDGIVDLFVKNSYDFGYFRNKGDMKWEEADWVQCTPNPNFSFEGQNVRLLDVNNDKLIDVVLDSGTSYYVWLNRKNNQWNTEFDFVTELPEGSHLSFTSSSTKLGDMNGDRMEDLVFVIDGYVSYFPNKGNGDFDKEVEIRNPPSGLGYLAAGLTLADINNDGLSDFTLIGNGSIMVWFNAGNNSFKSPATFEDTPLLVGGSSAFRFADMNGDGFRDLLFTDEDSENRFQYIDFNNGIHPNLLTKITNGLGMETTISYKASTEYYLSDRDNGKPWATKLPFPIQVVSSVMVKDNNSGQEYLTEYFYRDGYYDGAEKEFRGFAEVTKINDGDVTAPKLLTQYTIDVGQTEESRKGMIKSVATLNENGTVSPPSGLFDREDNTLTTRKLFTGTNGEKVNYSFTSSKTISIYENTATPKFLLHEFDQDNYGNTIKDYNYGMVTGNDKAVGKDEVLTDTEFCIDIVNWILHRPCDIRKTTLTGGFISRQKNYYDKGNLIRQEGTPDNVTFIALIRNDYDSYGNIIKITDANDHWREIGYDPTFHTFPVSETIGGLALTMFAGYDTGIGVVTSFQDFNGNKTAFGYDTFGRLTSIVKPGDSPQLPTQEFAYILSYPVSSVSTKSREISGDSSTYDTVTYYDGLGRKLQDKSEGPSKNWIVTDIAMFNKQKGIQKKWLPYFSADMAYEIPDIEKPYSTFNYDAKGRAVKEINPDSTFRSTIYKPLTKVSYDEEDNVAGPHANTPHSFVNDGLDRLVEVNERNGVAVYKTLYEYDGLNDLTKIIDNEGNIKTMTFDGLGRKISMNDPDKHEMAYYYDPAGNLISTTDAKKQTVAYTYDEANRILTENFNGVKVRYHYDSDLPSDYSGLMNTKGKLVYVEDEAGKEYYSYDKRGNTLVKIREADGFTFINKMSYDSMDRLTAFTYPDGFTIQYNYNQANQLDSLPGFVSGIDYISTGQKSKFSYANGIGSNYQYDNRQRMSKLKSEKASTVYQDLSYTYDTTSNIEAITDSRPLKTTENQTRAFQYDDLYRLTQASAPAWTESYQYSSIGNMTLKSDIGAMTYGAGSAGPHALTRAAGVDINYTYDANGNIASKQPGFTYQFDHKDRLITANRQSDSATIAFAYDYKGNRVTKSVTIGSVTSATVYADKFTELRKDNLIKQIFAGDRLVARTFSPFDSTRLVTRIASLTADDFDKKPKDGLITFAEIRAQGSDPDKVEENDAADALRIYQAQIEENPNLINFAAMAQAFHELNNVPQPSESIYFYLPDHLGSASIVTDESGNIVEESVFYPYGAERTRTGSFESEYRFTGKELDDETGLHYFGARYYDSQTGRFVSVDPLYVESIGDMTNNPQGLNIYAYSTNPVRFIDPNGLFWTEAFSIVKSAVIDAPLAFSGAVNKGIDKIADWGGDKILNYVVGDTSNMDDRTKAAVYGAAAEGISHTMDVTVEATGKAIGVVTSLATLDVIGVTKGIGEMGLIWMGEKYNDRNMPNNLFEGLSYLYGGSEKVQAAARWADIGYDFYGIVDGSKKLTGGILQEHTISKATKKLVPKMLSQARASNIAAPLIDLGLSTNGTASDLSRSIKK